MGVLLSTQISPNCCSWWIIEYRIYTFSGLGSKIFLLGGLINCTWLPGYFTTIMVVFDVNSYSDVDVNLWSQDTQGKMDESQLDCCRLLQIFSQLAAHKSSFCEFLVPRFGSKLSLTSFTRRLSRNWLERPGGSTSSNQFHARGQPDLNIDQARHVKGNTVIEIVHRPAIHVLCLNTEVYERWLRRLALKSFHNHRWEPSVGRSYGEVQTQPDWLTKHKKAEDTNTQNWDDMMHWGK